jgi:glycosyltransferase involved in cell wall biosynthesis
LFQKKPIVVDAFFSKYEAVIVDRKAYSKYHPKAFLYFVLDAIMIFSANLIIVDTQEHKEFFSKWRDPHKIHIVPVGVHTGEFFPILQQPLTNECFLVQFHGSYIPLQGIEHIVEAARILSNEKNIQFRFIGNGQEYLRIRDLVARYSLNIEFLPWLSIAELNTKLNEADAILGIFGDTEKTDRVIPNKIYQGLAVRKAVLSKDTVAIREQFTSDHLLLCKNSAESIAESIKTLCDNKFLRDHLADSGYHKIIDNFTQKQIGLTLMHILLKQST